MNKHKIFMRNALDTSLHSKCISMQVGCIAVNERDRIISTGVNGTASGYKNCCDVHRERGDAHSEWSLDFEIHAEMNCILEMARSSMTFKRVNFYVTHCPCQNCLKHMIGLRVMDDIEIDNIIYNEVYYKITPETLQKQKDYCALFGVNLCSLQEMIANEL